MKYTAQYKAVPNTKHQPKLNVWCRICEYWYNPLLGDNFNCWKIDRSQENALRLVSQIPVERQKPNYNSQKKYLPTLKKQSIAVQRWGEKRDLSPVPANTLQEIGKVDRARKPLFSGNCRPNRNIICQCKLKFTSLKPVAQVIFLNPIYTSKLLAAGRRDKFMSLDGNMREYADDIQKLCIDRNIDKNINAAINIKRVKIALFLTIKLPAPYLGHPWCYYR